MTFCPDCGCSATLHNAVNKAGSDIIAHCGSCGACWRTVNTPFVNVVLKSLEARVGTTRTTPFQD